VNRSNISVLPWVLHRHASGVFLVYALAGDLERVGDLLPGPAAAAGVAHLELLEALEQAAQCHDRAQADLGSALLAAAARSVASVMLSTYVDTAVFVNLS